MLTCRRLMCFNCAAPFRERLDAPAHTPPLCPIPRFNCAAPFRERLVLKFTSPSPGQLSLQLCRPLSGAVSAIRRPTSAISGPLQLCRPLSGAVRIRFRRYRAAFWAGFNCAAPFRERLGEPPHISPAAASPLQLCRPLSGAVSSTSPTIFTPAAGLQLCRPLSGAVSSAVIAIASRHPGASIVPPPFGSG